MTDVSLRDYFEQRLNGQREYFEERLRTMNEAVTKAAASVDHRLASMNEWRASLNDLSNRMETKEDSNKLEQRIKEIELSRAQFQGRTTALSTVWAIVVSLLIGLAGVALRIWR
jgi:uncharacterized protein (DUF3084 family)